MGKYVLILVFFLIIAFYAYNASMNELSSSSYVRNIEAYNTNQARNVALSAIQALLPKILDPDDTEFDVEADETKSFPDNNGYYPWEELKGRYRYIISNLDDSLLVVTAIGSVGDKSYSVRVNVEVGDEQWKPDFPFAIYSLEGFELKGSARIVGHIATPSNDEDAVKIHGMAVVDSSVYIGSGGNPGSVVDIPAWRPVNQAVKGDIKNLDKPVNYPMPDFPAFPDFGSDQGDITVSGGPANNKVLQPSEFNNLFFNEIKILSNRTLTLNLGNEERVVRVRKLDIQQGHLILTGDGSVIFYVENNFNIGGSSTLNEHGDADQSMIYYGGTNPLTIQGSTKLKSNLFIESADLTISGSGSAPLETGNIITGGQKVTIGGAGSVHCSVLYAPLAHVLFHGSGSATSAIVAKSFEASGNPRVFYPNSPGLSFPNFNGPGGSFSLIRSWD